MKIALSRSANQHSIRWRLPLSYAGIALLTALALSGLLLFTLRSYYDHREREYLKISAQTLARQVERMHRDDVPDETIQSAVRLFSFLAQARVQLLDADGQLTADSGPFDEQDMLNVSFAPPAPRDGEGDPGPYLSAPAESIPPPDGSGAPESVGGLINRYSVRAQRGPFGQLITDEVVSDERSDQRVTTLVYGPDGQVIGSLRLSEGPAFGSEIVEDVAEQGAVAGVIAVLIAAAAGAIISRGITQPVRALAGVTRQMAQGNLAARVELARRDEFGLLATTFNAMAERVETTVNTLRRFVEDAAHEINTPLTALRTNLELTAIYAMPDAARSDIQQSLSELTRLEKLTRSLLTLARLESPDMVLQRAPLDLTALIRQMHEQYASRAEQAGIALSVEIPGDTVIIQADQAQITRVIDNLLDNALKFTPAGEQVILGACDEGDTARLWVQDTGIGIPEYDLPRLFSRFHRGRNAAAYPGNGLGLVITRAIVEEHGGKIGVESSGGITRFTVTLPNNQKG